MCLLLFIITTPYELLKQRDIEIYSLSLQQNRIGYHKTKIHEA
jgi:hypothetical protein